MKKRLCYWIILAVITGFICYQCSQKDRTEYQVPPKVEEADNSRMPRIEIPVPPIPIMVPVVPDMYPPSEPRSDEAEEKPK